MKEMKDTCGHCTGRWHCIALHCTVLHCTALHCTALHCIAQDAGIALHCSGNGYNTVHCIVWANSLRNSVTLPYIDISTFRHVNISPFEHFTMSAPQLHNSLTFQFTLDLTLIDQMRLAPLHRCIIVLKVGLARVQTHVNL